MYQVCIYLIIEHKLKKLLDSNVSESLHLRLISPAVHMIHFSSI